MVCHGTIDKFWLIELGYMQELQKRKNMSLKESYFLIVR